MCTPWRFLRSVVVIAPSRKFAALGTIPAPGCRWSAQPTVLSSCWLWLINGLDQVSLSSLCLTPLRTFCREVQREQFEENRVISSCSATRAASMAGYWAETALPIKTYKMQSRHTCLVPRDSWFCSSTGSRAKAVDALNLTLPHFTL